MDKEMMSCEELKEEIIRIIQEIDNVEVLEEIYHIVKKLLKMELAEEQRKGSRCSMSYREKIIRLLDKIEESRLKEVYNFIVYFYLKGGI